MTARAPSPPYWIGLVEVERRWEAQGWPAGGVAWVIARASSLVDFERVVGAAPEFTGYRVVGWLEHGLLEPGYATEAFDGDAVMRELDARGQEARVFVDEVQWYEAEEPDREPGHALESAVGPGVGV